ncbi:MAG: hypothetical protein SYC29_10020 [Planctomycetota bacterium]|nr:hypothetical protein [Planctomycetota bacterium]
MLKVLGVAVAIALAFILGMIVGRPQSLQKWYYQHVMVGIAPTHIVQVQDRLREIWHALESYYSEYGKYPDSTDEWRTHNPQVDALLAPLEYSITGFIVEYELLGATEPVLIVQDPGFRNPTRPATRFWYPGGMAYAAVDPAGLFSDGGFGLYGDEEVEEMRRMKREVICRNKDDE